MTLPHEELRAIKSGWEFLLDLRNPQVTPRVPKAVRKRAGEVLRHYPSPVMAEMRYPDVDEREFF